MIKKEVMKMMEELYSPEGSMPMDGDNNPLSVRIMAKILQRFSKVKGAKE
jgi:hypothetical protein